MRNKQGLTAVERINKDLELAEMTEDIEHRRFLVHLVIAAAEFAIDFGLITYKEWGDLTSRAFATL